MAYSFHVSITGEKQGAFKGETTQSAAKGKIIGLSFKYEVESPRDPATGLPVGKRQHSPIRIVKAWGAASPQIFNALVTNETLTNVTLEFHRTDGTGAEAVYYRIKLTNASVANLHQFTNDEVTPGASSSGRAGSPETRELEEVSFVFGKIEIENLDAKTSTQDDWDAPRG